MVQPGACRGCTKQEFGPDQSLPPTLENDNDTKTIEGVPGKKP